ncbi:MAG: hypothetical protein U5K69_28275 [Balneolaceae bacterium]|nr:hypothetical protein [Balneolaceae bacterium]
MNRIEHTFAELKRRGEEALVGFVTGDLYRNDPFSRSGRLHVPGRLDLELGSLFGSDGRRPGDPTIVLQA